MLTIPPIGLTKKKGPIIEPPVFIAAATDVNGTGDSQVTVNKPTNTAEGDLMIFFWHGAGGGPAQIIGRPSGWTNEHAAIQNLDGFPAFEDCDIKIAGASEPANYTWSLSGGAEEGLACILTYRPAHATQLDVISGGLMSTSSATHTAPSVTSNFDKAMILSAYMVNRSGTGSVIVSTPPSGMTNRVSQDGSPASRSDLRLDVYEELQETAGLFSGKQIIYDASGDGYGITLAIRALGT